MGVGRAGSRAQAEQARASPGGRPVQLNEVAWDDDRRVWSLLVRRDETLVGGDGALVVVRRRAETEEGARA